MHLVGERPLSLHLFPELMRSCYRIRAKKSLTAPTRSIEYGRSSLYALMTLLNLEVADRPKMKGDSQGNRTHMGALRYRPTSFVSGSSLYPTNSLTLFPHATVSVAFAYSFSVRLCRASRW